MPKTAKDWLILLLVIWLALVTINGQLNQWRIALLENQVDNLMLANKLWAEWSMQIVEIIDGLHDEIEIRLED